MIPLILLATVYHVHSLKFSEIHNCGCCDISVYIYTVLSFVFNLNALWTSESYVVWIPQDKKIHHPGLKYTEVDDSDSCRIYSDSMHHTKLNHWVFYVKGKWSPGKIQDWPIYRLKFDTYLNKSSWHSSTRSTVVIHFNVCLCI